MAALALALVTSCGGGDHTRVRTRQAADLRCPAAVNPSGNPGSDCSDAAECQEYCCGCPGGVNGYGANACIESVCGQREAVCAAALERNAGLCP